MDLGYVRGSQATGSTGTIRFILPWFCKVKPVLGLEKMLPFISMTLRTIIFDFGNVLGFFDHGLITGRLAEHSSLTAEAIHAALFGGPLEQDFDSGRISVPEFLRYARDRCKLTCADEDIVHAWTEIFTVNEEVCRLLPRLKGRYRLLLGSNTNELHTAQFSRQFAEHLRHLDHLVFSHDIKARKPEAAFFQHCVQIAGCTPQEAVFIDDLPANIAGAQACGLHGIVYRRGADLPGQLAALGVTTTTNEK